MYRSILLVGLTLALLFAGCTASGPHLFRKSSEEYYGGPEPGTDAWWSSQAAAPVGVRQKYYKGKAWPPSPRPTGPKQQFTHRFHSAHYWPHPYTCWDRQAVEDPVAIQESNGWEAAATLYDYHFDTKDQQLTNAGRSHLHWILTHTPPQYRRVSVQAHADRTLSEVRLQNVTALATQMSRDGIPHVSLRETDTIGRPAEEVDAIRRKELSTIPDPRVLYTGGGGIGYGSSDQ